ncbi:DUF2254 domain-containing protein [Stutzerimonas stutzeri]|jgi:uncharacterized membrane protein|uniref:DUF2254 domain-containing protein n=1 Tax=Stutzerimonas stutzeri TaxID=316 RepID=A0AA42PD06_STUST|nr:MULTISPECIES: DUF2254 domain-containing protein [Stutzerimonas]OHC16515.1 MAG: hypothetical protein A2883_00880 [Pseudomonadales bacterium RIFCSPHIGHO2_01_FULL_64_12]HAR05178.1 DUF2254 domain-containing protein [Pseudomonas sp.]MBK3806534.1 DUF2254 domain-containing protein [Stutzerimonas stutzeri]MBK3851508.1 DUF2254 domain-containing protein [Stutzerimonas stutzeri]MDH0211292.1 DUF2254 domain-containing protein [Stutzerimonas stutzeri]
MSAVTNRLFRLYHRVTGSIAFYPTLIAVGLASLCVVTIVLEMTWLQPYKEDLDLGLVKNADNARLILGTLVAGIISLMVFSFSMVMVVLNSAASSLSPRVIPGLISSRSHQVVLGVYLGTIINSLMLISTIQEGDDINVPSLGIFLALGLAVICLCLFVYFIRSISLSIQVDFILNRVYKQTLAQLRTRRRQLQDSHGPAWPDDAQWSVVRARRSGYFKALNVTAAHDVLDEHDARMTVQVHYGFFVMPGHPLMRIDRELDDDCTNRLLDCFDFYVEEYAHRHFFFGFKQIVEIAVRALSPGINDPGTAIKAIDMLSVLLAERMEMPDHEVAHAQDRPRIFIRELNLHQLLQMTFGPQRRYGADDLQVLQALLQACKNLLYAAKDADTERVLLRHAQAVVDQAAISLSGALDRQAMVEAVRSLNQAVRHAEPLQCATLRES